MVVVKKYVERILSPYCSHSFASPWLAWIVLKSANALLRFELFTDPPLLKVYVFRLLLYSCLLILFSKWNQHGFLMIADDVLT